MADASNDITLKTVLQHVQMLAQNIFAMEQRLSTRIDSLEKKMEKLELKVDRNHEQAMRNHAITVVGLKNIDDRLDDLEVVQVPAIKKAVGMGP